MKSSTRAFLDVCDRTVWALAAAILGGCTFFCDDTVLDGCVVTDPSEAVYCWSTNRGFRLRHRRYRCESFVPPSFVLYERKWWSKGTRQSDSPGLHAVNLEPASSAPVPGSLAEVMGLERNLYLGRVYGGGNGLIRLDSGDFNEDGYPDLLGIGSKTSFFMGGGVGRFLTTIVSNLNSAQGALVVDLNRDQHLDLVLLGADRRLTTLAGLGDGTFGVPVTLSLSGPVWRHAAGDVDGDGFPEVVVVPNLGDLALFRGGPDGLLVPAGPVPRPDAGLADVVLADLDGDARAELIWHHSGSPGVRVMSGIGSETPGTVQEVDLGPEPPTALAVADVNDDGWLDLVAGAGASGTLAITIVTNGGGGVFESDKSVSLDGGKRIAVVEVRDLNGDGRLDIAVQTAADQGSLADFRAFTLEAGEAGAYDVITVAESLAVQPGTVLDVTGDGRADGAFVAGGGFVVMEGQADGRLQLPSRINLDDGVLAGTGRVAAGDLDNDGNIDLVSRRGTVLFNSGQGDFEPVLIVEEPGILSQLGTDLALGDADKDGDLDVWFALGADRFLTSNVVRIFLQGPARVFTNHVDHPIGPAPVALVVDDLDTDGRPDAVTLNRPADAASVSLILGVMGPEPRRITVPLPDLPGHFLWPDRIDIGDVTDDGQPEVLVLSKALRVTQGGYVTVIRRAASGAFEAAVPHRLGNGRFTGGGAAGDFNRDGLTDMAVLESTATGQQVALFFADGRGGFVPGPAWAAGRLPHTFMAVADLDRDGAPDLVASGEAGVTLYAGLGQSAFPIEEEYFLNGVSGTSIVFADLDGDAWPEWIAGGSIVDVRRNRGLGGDAMLFGTLLRRLAPAPGDYPFRRVVEDYPGELFEIVEDAFDVYQRACREREARFRELMEAWIAFVNGQPADVTIPQEAVDDLNLLLDAIVERASPELAAALEAERESMDHLQTLVGLPIQQAFSRLGLQEQLTILGVHLDEMRMRIGIDRAPGGQYILQRLVPSETAEWQAVAGAIEETEDGRVCLVDPTLAPAAALYRVMEVLPPPPGAMPL